MLQDRAFQPNAQPILPKDRRAVAVAIQGSFDEPSDQQTYTLPKVVASGYGKLAEQILDMAFENGVKVREDADLAELLAMLDLDSPIPSEAIVAVAEILAKVYEANAVLSSQEPFSFPLPDSFSAEDNFSSCPTQLLKGPA